MSDGNPAPPVMKLLFLILAHDRPEDAAGLARCLVAAGSEARALIHYDARGKGFEALEAAVADEPRIGLVADRVACRWGGFGLVEAPLNALAQAEAEGMDPDYVILLSGACLPCRPVASLERFLTENAGREFIESEEESWITGGWRSERWRYWHVFDHRTQNLAEHLSAKLQGLLRIRRRFPKGLTPRFGSQWWTLTWPACQAMLADIRRDPKRLAFFRTVWIPDEMVIQTWIHALVPPEAIAHFGLTHFQFTNRGKPVVFHDDHADYVASLDCFFFRKVSPEARALRAACLARAAEPDDSEAGGGAPLRRIGLKQDSYRLKVWAQTRYHPPGALFFRDQFADRTDPVLAAVDDPYIVLVGPPGRTQALAGRMPEPPFLGLGEIFAPREVDLGRGRMVLGGMRRTDTAIRNRHPALWLARIRARARAAGLVPVIPWSPANRGDLLAAVLRDPAALVVTLPPRTGDLARDRATLAAASLGPARARTAALPLGLPEGALPRAVYEASAGAGTDMGLWMVGGMSPPAARHIHALPPPGFHRGAPDPWVPEPALRAPDLELPWGGTPAEGQEADREAALRTDREAALRAGRMEALAASLAGCRFRGAGWFPAFAETVTAFAGREEPSGAGAADPAARRRGRGKSRGRTPDAAGGETGGETTRQAAEAVAATDELPEAAEG